ncbi:hypothetical protein SOCEGT47_008110 [Sorangium cellulosum]|uniref:Uncharacterized protein n=1 Tax=Sorangium cellulosum TaxID=56 RepID=A0A4P2PV93_SORCE|nr:hypothetical protein [Sorangium cellulosum]AUX20343.1 hypothetical protein SOCEGT47_008110 [Sorangium cellulosum]
MTSSLFPLVPLGSGARKAAALVAGLAVTAAASGCATKQCTEMGCVNSFSILTGTADKSWPAGEYTLELTVDGDAVSCAYRWTNTPQPGGGGVFVQCSPTVMVSVNPVTTCTETRDSDSVSQSCTPVPGQFTQGIAIHGTPARVDVVARRDGAVLGERSFTPEYKTSYPNGEGCPPACRGDAQRWELP